MPSERADGWYWVRRRESPGRWQVAEWRILQWWLVSSELTYSDSAFIEIGNGIIAPVPPRELHEVRWLRKKDGEWTVGRWCGNGWEMLGIAGIWGDVNFDFIGERITRDAE